MTRRILGIVTQLTGRFTCRRCQREVEMVAIIDQRNVKSRIWRETSEHSCDPLSAHPYSKTVIDKDGNYYWDKVAVRS